MQAATDRFSHRCNQNGTFDSICTVCFLTSGHCSTEYELRLLEANHVCDAEVMAVREQIGAKLANEPNA
jgi:hypothetical protein